MIWCESQLEFLCWLKELRGPIGNSFFIIWHFFDSVYFGMTLITFSWLGISRKWGIRIFYLCHLALWNLILAKWFFHLPRPCDLVEGLALVHVGKFGFPSGGAQNAMIIAGMLVLYWKHRLAWPLAIFYFICMSFSRLYLGVHFPLDLVGGWILGLMALGLFYGCVERIERWCDKHLPVATLLSIILPLVSWILLSFSFPRLATIMASCTAAGIGIFLSRFFHHIPLSPKTIFTAFFRSLIGIIGTFVIFFATHSPFLLYLWISWLAGAVVKKI